MTTLAPPAGSGSGAANPPIAAPGMLDASIVEIKEEIKRTALRPGFSQMRSFLFSANNNVNNNHSLKDESDVINLDGVAGVNQEEYERLKTSIVKIKKMIYK